LTRKRGFALRANLITFALGLVFATLAAEGLTRLFWSGAPAADAGAPSLPLLQVRDPRILYRLPPGSSGVYNGTMVSINAMGLRDRDYPIPAAEGTGRVMLLGDSMVFGVGLPEARTLPSQIEERMNAPGGAGPVEVINAGVFGYNILQEFALLQDVGPEYRPGLVVACFVHNDIENWGLGDGGAVPAIASSRFEPPPRDAWSTRLAELMVPGAFDPERLNLLPGETATGLRGWLATHSRLYLFTHLRLRTHSWNLTSGERRDPIVDSRSCRTQEVIWEALRLRYREMARTAAGWGGRLVVVVLGAQLWEGRPLEELLTLLREEGIAHLDLTPVWKDPGFYAREYSLGWDPHPNERATALAAELVIDFIGKTRDSGARPPGPHDVIAAREDLRGRLEEWLAGERERVARDDAAWSAQQRTFLPMLDAAAAPLARHPQILYGFWGDEIGLPDPPVRDEPGTWMSRSGALLLGNAGDAAAVTLDLTLPIAAGHPPSSLFVTLSAPPAACGIAAGTYALHPDIAGRVRLRVEVPESLRDAATIEVRLEVEHSMAASALRAGGSAAQQHGARRVSLYLRGAKLERAGSDAVPASAESVRPAGLDRDLH